MHTYMSTSFFGFPPGGGTHFTWPHSLHNRVGTRHPKQLMATAAVVLGEIFLTPGSSVSLARQKWWYILPSLPIVDNFTLELVSPWRLKGNFHNNSSVLFCILCTLYVVGGMISGDSKSIDSDPRRQETALELGPSTRRLKNDDERIGHVCPGIRVRRLGAACEYGLHNNGICPVGARYPPPSSPNSLFFAPTPCSLLSFLT